MTTSPPTSLGSLMAQITRRLLIATGAITVVALLVGGILDGAAGGWGAAIGGAVGLIFCLTTVISMRMSEGRSPQFLAVAVLGGWLAKMAIIIVILAVLQDLTFYNRYVLVGTLLTIVCASLAIEMLAIRGARIPVVEPAPSDE